MDTECPGRRNVRKLDSLLVRCPKCGAAVEIFTDEVKARCRCGELLLRESVPACISWCASAERCLGEVVDLRLIRERIEAACGQGSADAYVKEIAEKAAKGQHHDCPAKRMAQQLQEEKAKQEQKEKQEPEQKP